MAARVHSEASVSSPTIRFYRPGTELQLVRRKNGWLELLDPATQERGWIFEKYLVSIDAPSPRKLQWNRPLSPYRPKRHYQKQKRSAKSAVRVADDV